MKPEFKIREFSFDADYDSVLNLWRGIEVGMHVGPSDSPEEIKRKLERDPDLFLISEFLSEGDILSGQSSAHLTDVAA